MYETHVTVVGRVATDIGHSRLNDGTALAKFRSAGTTARPVAGWTVPSCSST
jgi:hypothetical protein